MSESPKVWSKFTVKKKDGTVVKLRIIDAPETISEDVLTLYVKYFVNEESTFIAAGVPGSREAMQELQRPLLEEGSNSGMHVVVCCLDNGDDQNIEVIGASMMAVTSKNDRAPEYEFKTKEMQKLWLIAGTLISYYDETTKFDLERRFSDKGLFVRPEYRGLGIAQELFKVRRLICKEFGVAVHGAWMTSYGTQKAAERDGWEVVCEVKYEDLEKKIGMEISSDLPSAKFMIARIQ
ncbi:hypothetical protein PYW07_017003 [Mythimna separata]|uniref:N-acetyltransferase domain-containing protein n=1 Tax=Mythimna separata TaxID=271217 RepID=A0AAD8DX42_MYTSE|nr:hypothetical protein PYW07_017003 [Mythimna separata]